MFFKKYIPYSVVLELTLKCNMNCIHCGSAAGTSRQNEMTTNQWINTIDGLAELSCHDITLIGGEVFLRKDWGIIAQAVKDVGIKLNFVSNGWLMNNTLVAKVAKLSPSGVALSIDGALAASHDTIRQCPGSFVRCLDALSLLKKAGIPTGVITTVHKKNLHELPHLRDILASCGVAWQIQIADSYGRFPMDLHLDSQEFYSVALFIASTRRMYSSNELLVNGAHCIGYHSMVLPDVNIIPFWKGCQAGIRVLGIQSDGSVKGCLSLPDGFVEGNVTQTSIQELWNHFGKFSYNRKFSTEDLKGSCKNCKFGKTCKGGCLAVSISTTNEPHHNPFCHYHIEQQFLSQGG